LNISEIRRKAIPYYACYISTQLKNTSAVTIEQLEIKSWNNNDGAAEGMFLLEDGDLIEDAVRYLEEAEIVTFLPDEFGPQLLIPHRNLADNINKLYGEDGSAFQKYSLAGEGRFDWLNQALRNINKRIKAEQEIPKPSSSSSDVWEPIPLDRNDTRQEQATEALARLIEELRGDNGYAAINPEEKAFVQDGLSAVAKRLKENTQISWMYLQEFAFKPLGILIKRFGGAAIGITAATAKEAFVSWLKSKGISFLDNMLN